MLRFQRQSWKATDNTNIVIFLFHFAELFYLLGALIQQS